jgi:RHS repeat-associated protein
MTRNGQTYTYHSDALGSIIAITDGNNTVVQRYEYDAYGNITYLQDPGFKQPYAYTGREWDEESGLYYYRARYYDPGVGRFVESDPIGLAGGINRYAYVEGDPINQVDPEGLKGKPGPGVMQVIFPAHTAALCRNPIGGSTQSQIEYANAINSLRKFNFEIGSLAIKPLAPTYISIPLKMGIEKAGGIIVE